jgi:hypothetical protein
MNIQTCHHDLCVVVYDFYINPKGCPVCQVERNMKELEVILDKIEEAKPKTEKEKQDA